MVRRIPSVVAAVALFLGTAGSAGTQEEAIEQARTAALAWLPILDAHQYDDSWEAAGEALRGAVTQKEWTLRWSATLGPLGAVTSRGVKSSKYSTTMFGAPDGEYVVLGFDTARENKRTVVETVVLRKEPDGLWRVSGYRIH